MKASKSILILMLLALVISIVVGGASYILGIKSQKGKPTFENLKINPTTISQTYVACGCGCCGSAEPVKQCLYHSNGDNLEQIINQDKKSRKNSQCALMGCSNGIGLFLL